MIKSSKKFNEYLHKLYDANKINAFSNKSFEEIFESNKTRIEYLNKLFEEYFDNQLNSFGESVFREVIDYIVSFVNGKEKQSSTTIPDKYFNDKSIGAVIPTIEEMKLLLKLIESNKIMFEMIYEDNPLYINLPDESFNENMTRVLEIKKHNIAHLLGLTEHEDLDSNNPSKNLLKKHFFSTAKNTYEGNTDAEKLLNWITSSEGINEVLRVHNITLNFVANDKILNPNCYDGENLKSDTKTIADFKKRYKKSTGLDYPIINFSRLIVKSINTLNFMKLSNLVEVILDFNAPKGVNNEKDIFLVNRNSKKLSSKNNKFMSIRDEIIIDLYRYANEPENEELKNKLMKCGININSQSIKDQLNIIKAYDFIGAYGIEPDDSIIDEKIIEAINKDFERNVNLIGFGTDFQGDEEIPLDKSVTHMAHCDTSISLTIPELIGCYYKRGRSFFLDKIESEKEDVLMVSNINDEIYYLKRVIDIKKNARNELDNLIELKNTLNENYNSYLQVNERRR